MAESPDLTRIRALTDYLDSARGWDIPTYTEYQRLRDIALAAAERLAGERDALRGYATALEDELEDYHPADLQPVVTRTDIIARCRKEHGITPEMIR